MIETHQQEYQELRRAQGKEIWKIACLQEEFVVRPWWEEPMSTDQTTTTGTANFGGMTEEPEDAELHHISENAVCNTEEVIEVTGGRRAASPNKPVMIFA